MASGSGLMKPPIAPSTILDPRGEAAVPVS
jgi:hypothetical protein